MWVSSLNINSRLKEENNFIQKINIRVMQDMTYPFEDGLFHSDVFNPSLEVNFESIERLKIK